MAKRSIAESYIFSLLYNILTIITPLITAPYLARVLEPDGVGIYSLTLNNVNYFVVFGVLGLGTYGQLEIAKVRDDLSLRSRKFFEIFITRLITHGISIVCFSIVLMSVKQYQTIYVIQGMILVASMFDVTWFFQGIEEYKKIAVRNISLKVIGVILILTIVKTKSDLVVYTVINIMMALFSSVCFWPTLKRYLCGVDYKQMSFWPHVKGAFVYFVPAVAAMITLYVDKTMLDIITNSPGENGCYAQAENIVLLCFSLFISFNQIMRSRMAYLFSNSKKEDIMQLMRKSLEFVVFISFPIAFGMAGIATNFVPWFFGDGYEKVSILMMIFAGWMIIKPISSCVLEQDYMSSGRQRLFNCIIWIGAITNVIFNAVLITFFASIGAAIASVVAEFAVLTAALLKCSDNVKIMSLLGASWKYCIAAAIMLLVMTIISDCMDATVLTTVTQCIVAGIVYMGLLLLFRDQVCKEILKRLFRGQDN